MFRFLKRWLPSKEERASPGRLLGQSITLMRREYAGEPFGKGDVADDPVKQFESWFREAVKKVKDDPNAMTLSTADLDGRPSARVVLLKEYGQDGFIFYTSYGSRKGRELDDNRVACLSFYWPDLLRQVRIEGRVEKVSQEKSESYWNKRPRASQLGAWTSSQSEEVESRSELEKKFEEMDKKFGPGEVPRPADWGGYVLSPDYFEFWQGRMNRLHDRICYRKDASGKWNILRLGP